MLKWFAIGGERFGELDAHEAGYCSKKEKKSADLFFLAAWQGFMDFFCRSTITVQLKRTTKGKSENFYASYTLFLTAGSWKCKDCGLTQSKSVNYYCSGRFFQRCLVISKCRNFFFSFLFFSFWNRFCLPTGLKLKQPKPP